MKNHYILSIFLLIIISIVLTGCGNEQEKARSELGKMNIAYTPESFLDSIQNNDSVVAKLFIQVGMDANLKNQEGDTVLMLAAKTGNTEIVDLLLSKGAQVDAKSSKNNTALEYAASEGRLDIVKILLDKKADINNMNDLGMTPLMCAIDKGHTDVAKELIAKGADLNKKLTNFSHSAYSIAKGNENKEILDILVKAGVEENSIKRLEGIKAMDRPASVTATFQTALLANEDFKLDGLELGDTVDKIVERYGKPDKVKEYEFPGFGGGNPVFVMYTYQDNLIVVHFLKSSNKIFEIQSRASNIFTPRNIAVGHLDKDMFALYGNKSAEGTNNAGNLIYSYSPDSSPIALDFEVNPNTHQIISISINLWSA